MKDRATELMNERLTKYFGEDYSTIKKSDIDTFFVKMTKNSNYTTAKGYVSVLNRLFREKNIDITMSISDYDIKEKTQTKGIYSLDEVEYAINNLINPIDKFIVLAIYNGITGNRYSELLNLKRTDIDLKNSTICVGGKTIVMDKLFKKITIDALNQTEYAYLTTNGDIKYYEFNLNSEYVLRTKPLKRNRNGLEPIGFEGFKTRFKNIVKSIDLETTVSTLEKSGYIHKLREIKENWTAEEMRGFIKDNKINVDCTNLLRLYNNFYGEN